jgi:hypothetical protein
MQRLKLTRLEERIAFDVTALETIFYIDSQDTHLQKQMNYEHSKLASLATNLKEGLFPIDSSHVVVIGSDIEDHSTLERAAEANSLVVSYDSNNISLEQLATMLSQKLNGQRASSIAFACHGTKNGSFLLTSRDQVSLDSLLHSENMNHFWRKVGRMIDDKGRIDLLSCDLGQTPVKNEFLGQLEQLTKRAIGVSDQKIGSPHLGGTWTLNRIFEHGNLYKADIDTTKIYFNSKILKDWSGIFALPLDLGFTDTSIDNSLSDEPLLANLAPPQDLYSSSTSYYNFGQSVSVGAKQMIAGGSGIVEFFEYAGNAWARTASFANASSTSFGNRVAIWEDQNLAIVGDDGINTATGAITCYTRNSNAQWSSTTLSGTLPTLSANNRFGCALACDGNYLVVGAYGDSSNKGAVYVYNKSSSLWTKITPTAGTPGANTYFGCSVAIDETRIVVGAYNSGNSGAAYIYDLIGSTWTESQRIVSSDASSGNRFGYSVAISGDRIAVGAYAHSPVISGITLNGAGAVYIFEKGVGNNPNTWGQTVKLTPTEISSNDQFGYSVGLKGNALAASSFNKTLPDPTGTNVSAAGQVYLFEKKSDLTGSNLGWAQVHNLTKPKLSSTSDSSSNMGSSLALNDQYIVIGIKGDDTKGSNNGKLLAYQVKDMSAALDHYDNLSFDIDQVGTISDGASGATLLGGISDIIASGNYTYTISTTDQGLTVFDNTDPYNLVYKGQISLGAVPSSFDVYGNYVYVASSAGSWIKVINVANPSSPTLAGTLSLAGAVKVEVFGTKLYVFQSSSNSLRAYDLASNPTTLISSTPLTNTTYLAPTITPVGMCAEGSFLYIANSTNKISIINISGTTPTYSREITSVTAQPKALAIKNNCLYVLGNTGNSIQIYDVSPLYNATPTNPVLIKTLSNGTDGNNLSGLVAITIEGKYAYVSSTTKNAVSVIDIADPRNAFIVKEIVYNTNNITALNGVKGIAVKNSCLYTADTTVNPTVNRLSVFKLHTPDSTVSTRGLQFTNSFKQYLTLPSYTLTTSAITLEARIYLQSTPTGNSMLFDLSNGSTNDNILLIVTSQQRITLSCYRNNTSKYIYSNTVLSLNTWYYIAASIDSAGNAAIYINGLVDIAGGISTVINIPNNVLRSTNYIGKSSWSSNPYFNGIITEARIWNIKRSQMQILANMRAPLTGNEANLVAYYPFNEEKGDIVYDLSHKNRHAILKTDYTDTTKKPTRVITNDSFNVKYSIQFNGSSNYITLNPSTSPGANFTQEIWVKAIYPKGDSVSHSVWGGNSSWPDIPPTISIKGLSIEFRYGDEGDVYSGIPPSYLSTADVLNYQEWNHIAVTCSTGSAYANIYVNGVQVLNAYAIFFNGTAAVNLFGKADSSYFGGQVAEARYWNYDRSLAEIRSTMLQPLQGNEAGLLAYYNFNEGAGSTLYDLLGSNRIGTLTNGPTWKRADSIYSSKFNGLYFDGTNDSAKLPTLPAGTFATNSITLEAWINPYDLSSAANTTIFDLGNGAPSNNICLRFNSTTKKLALISYNGTAISSLLGSNAISEGVWTHVSAVINTNDTASIYINGKLDTSGTVTAPTNVARANCYIGKSSLVSTYYKGVLEKVRVWNIALTQQQIQDYMYHVPSKYNTNLVVSYSFKESSSQYLYDISGNGNNAILGTDSNYANDDPTYTIATPRNHSHHYINLNKDIILSLAAYDPDGTTFSAIIKTLPSQGTLYQYSSGTASYRGAPITTAGTALTDPQCRVVYYPNMTGASNYPRTYFDYNLKEGSTETTSSSVYFNLAPIKTVYGTVSNQAVTDKTTIQPFSNITIARLDLSQKFTYTITLDTAAKGSLIGTIGNYDSTTGVYTITASPSVAQAAIRSTVFTPRNNAITPGSTETTTFTIKCSDGSISDSTTTVITTSINDPSIFGGAVANQTITDKAVIQPFANITITDVDYNQSNTYTVTLSNKNNGILSATGGIDPKYNSSTGVYTFTGTASAAQAGFRNIVFTPTANQVTPGSNVTTVFTLASNDGATSNNTTSVIATSVNDPSIFAVTTNSYFINDNTNTQPFFTLTITDVDYSQSNIYTITLSNKNNGSLSGLGGTYNPATGIYTFSGTAVAAQTCFRNLVFNPTPNQAPVNSTVTTFFDLASNEGAMSTNAVSVTTTSINDPSLFSILTPTQSIFDNTTVQPFLSLTITDPDFGQSNTYTVTLNDKNNGILSGGNGSYDATTGIYSFTGTVTAAEADLRSLTFVPTANQVAIGLTITTDFSLASSDSGSSNALVSIDVLSVNDASIFSATVANQSITDNATIYPFTNLVITDPDLNQSNTYTITLSSPNNGTLSGGSGSYNSATGVYTFTGTATLAQSCFHNVVFSPTPNQVSIGSTVTTIFSLNSSDGANTDNITSVITTSVNSPSTFNGMIANQAVNDNTTIQPFSSLIITDPDINQTNTYTAAISSTLNGSLSNGSGSYDVTTGIYTFSGTAAAAQADFRNLIFTPTLNQASPGATIATTFTLASSDGAISDSTTSVITTPVNDPSSFGGTIANQIVNDNATIQPFAALTINDVDPNQSNTYTVALNAAANGVLSGAGGSYNAGTGVYTFTGTAAAAQTYFRNLIFSPTTNQVTPGSTVTTTFTLSSDDGATSDNTTTVVATSINDPSVFSGISTSLSINDNSTVQPFANLVITDLDPSQSNTYTITLSASANGSLSGTGGTYNAATGVYSFTGTASAAQACFRNLLFTPTANQASVGSTITTNFTLSSDDGATSNSSTTVVVTSMNDPSIFSSTLANQAVNDNATIQPFSSLLISDADPNQTNTYTISLSAPANGTLSGGTGTYNSATGIYTFSGTAAAAQACFRSVIFTPTANQVSLGSTVTTTFNLASDDGATSNSNTTVIATPINNPSIFSGAVAGQTVNDNATRQPFTSLVITDVDPNQSNTYTITLSAATNGTLSGGTGTYNTATGVYTFTGTAAAAQTCFRSVVFTPKANQVSVGSTVTTTFTLASSDGATSNNTTTVIATSINNPSVFSGAVAGQTVNDNATRQPFTSLVITDVDPSQSNTYTVTLNAAANGSLSGGTGTYNAATGVYTFTGTAAAAQTCFRSLTFTPTPNQVSVGSTVTTRFTLASNDGATSNNTTTVIATSINNPSTFSGAVAGQTVNDNTTITPFTSLVIADSDLNQSNTYRVTLNAAANGMLSGSGGSYNATTGVYTFTGTASAAQACFRNLVFTPKANQVAVGSSVTTTFTLSSTDGATSNSTTTVIATSINDPSIFSGTLANQSINDNATIQPFSSLIITDPDINQTNTYTATISSTLNGSLSNGSGSYGITTGIYTFSGTAAAAQADFRNLIFTPTLNQESPGATVTTTFTLASSDGAISDSTTSVITTSINDPSSFGGTVANQVVNDNATIQPFAALTINDVDPNQSNTYTVALNTAANGVLSGAGGSYNAGTGVYTFTGTAAAAQTCFRNLIFSPTTNQVAPGSTVTTTFTLSSDDGATSDNTTTVVATSINDPSIFSGVVAGQTLNDNSTLNPFTNLVITDLDPSQSNTYTITLSASANGSLSGTGGTYNAATGVYSFTGTASAAQACFRNLLFTPTTNQVSVGSTVTTTFTLSSDDGATSNNSTSVIVTSINDPSIFSGTLANQAVNDNATIQPFNSLIITDPDINQTNTYTATISSTFNGSLSNGSGSYDVTTGIYTFSGTAAAAQADFRNLIFTPTLNQASPGATITTTFTLASSDGAISDSTTSVITTPVNDPSSFGGTVANQVVNDNATIQPFAALSINDVDPNQSNTYTVALNAAANGVLSGAGGSYNAGTGIYTFTGTAAAAQTCFRNLIFSPTTNQVTPGSTVTTTFTLSSDDGATSDNTTTVVATSINDPSVFSGISTSLSINDNATVQPFANLVITDLDPSQSNTYTITLSASANGSLSGIGGTYNAATGVYSFTGTASAAQACFRNLLFTPTANQASVGSTITTNFTLSSDDGATSNSSTTVVVTSMNDPSIFSSTLANQAVNDNATIQPFSSLLISDADPNQTNTYTISLSAPANGTLSGGTGTYNSATGIYTFSGTAAAAQACFRSVIFTPTANQVSLGSTVTTTFNLASDDGATSNSNTTVIATPINNPSIFSGAVAGQTVNDNATRQPFTSLVITDVDPNQSNTYTITLSAATNGTLSGGTGTYNTATGVYTFTGTAAAAQTCFRSVVFTPKANQVSVGSTVTTTFTLASSDGATSNNTTTVIATSINNPSVFSGAVAGQTVNDNATRQPFTSLVITDVDPSQSNTYTVTLNAAANGSLSGGTGTYNAATGVYTFTGTAAAAQTCFRSLTFTPTPNQVSVGSTVTTRFTLASNDGATSNNTTTVIATSINNPSTFSGAVAGQTVNDNTTITPFTSLVIADSDLNQSNTYRVTLNAAANGTLSGSGGSYNATTGVYTFTGTASAAQACFRNLVFTPKANQVAVGSSVTTTFTLTSTDGATSNSTTTVIATSINNAPTVSTTTIDLPPITEDDINNAGHIISTVFGSTISDVDIGAIKGIAITSTTVNSGTGEWQYALNTGPSIWGAWITMPPVDDNNSLLLSDVDKVRFLPDEENATTANFTYRAWDQTTPGTVGTTVDTSINGGTTAFSITQNTARITITSQNDAPELIPGTYTFSPIDEDAVTDAANPGTLVSTIFASSITDVDTAAAKGIAITSTSVNTGTGTWQYSTNSGTTWNAMNVPSILSATNSLLLRDIDMVRFLPDGNNGATASFTYRAWDQTSGAAGSKAATTSNGGTTAFSIVENTANISVNSINDPSVFNNVTLGIQTTDDNTGIKPFQSLTISDIDDSQSNTYTITLSNKDNGSLSATGGIDSNYNVTTGIYAYTGTATDAQTWFRNITFIPTPNQVAPGSTVTTDFTLASDDSAISNSNTRVVVTSVNDFSAFSGLIPGSQNTDDKSTINPFASLVITDPDYNQSNIYNIVLSNKDNGSLSATGGLDTRYNSTTGIYTFAGTAADAQAWFRNLVFTPTANQVAPGLTVTTDFTLMSDDGASPNSSIRVVVTSVNDAPLLASATPSLPSILATNITNNGRSINMLIGTSISDADIASLKGIAITGAIITTGNGTWEFSVDAGNSWSAIPVVADNNALLLRTIDRVRFLPDGSTASTGSITYRAWDQTSGIFGTIADASVNGGTTAFSLTTNTASIIVDDINDAPILANASPNLPDILASDVNNAGELIGNILGSTISDADIGALAGIAITATTVSAGVGTWEYSINSGSSWTAIPAVSTSNALLLRETDRIRFQPNGFTASTASFTYHAWDRTIGAAGTAVDASITGGTSAFSIDNNTATITVADINDAPVLATTPVTLASISEDDVNNLGSTVNTIIGASITDVDIGAIKGIAITSLMAGTGTWEYSIDNGSSWIDIAPVDDNHSLLLRDIDKVRFIPDEKNSTIPTFNFRAWDQTTGSVGTKVPTISTGGTTAFSIAECTASITVTDVNDPSIFSGTISGQTISDDDTIKPFLSIVITDVDMGQYNDYTISLNNPSYGSLSGGGSYNSAAGVYTFTGTATDAQSDFRNVIFTPTPYLLSPGSNFITSFILNSNDGAAPDNNTTVIVSCVNHPSLITGGLLGRSVDDNHFIMPFVNLTISDPDYAQLNTYTITLDNPINGILSGGTGLYDISTGIYTFTGTASQAEACFQNLTFIPTSNQTTVGSSTETRFKIESNDDAGHHDLITVLAISVNDISLFSGTVTNQLINDNTTVQPFPSLNITDIDYNHINTYTVTLSNPQNGTISGGLGSYNPSTGIYSFTGNAIAATNDFRSLIFIPAKNQVAVGSSVTTIFTLNADDGATPDSNTIVTVMSINDSSIITGAITIIPISSQSNVQLFSGFTITDDDPNQINTYKLTISDPTKGDFIASSVNENAFSFISKGLYEFKGTAQQAQKALRQLTFQPINNPSGGTATVSFTIESSDGAIFNVNNKLIIESQASPIVVPPGVSDSKGSGGEINLDKVGVRGIEFRTGKPVVLGSDLVGRFLANQRGASIGLPNILGESLHYISNAIGTYSLAQTNPVQPEGSTLIGAKKILEANYKSKNISSNFESNTINYTDHQEVVKNINLAKNLTMNLKDSQTSSLESTQRYFYLHQQSNKENYFTKISHLSKGWLERGLNRAKELLKGLSK